CIRDFHVTGVQTCALPIYHERKNKQDNKGSKIKLLFHRDIFSGFYRFLTNLIILLIIELLQQVNAFHKESHKRRDRSANLTRNASLFDECIYLHSILQQSYSSLAELNVLYNLWQSYFQMYDFC